MKKRMRLRIGGCTLACAAIIALQGCASLEPMPRFRTSSTSFAPDQLPIAHRSSSDLVDPSTVGAYSVVKQEALQKNVLGLSVAETQRLIVNQSAGTGSLYVDEVGLDREQLDDDLGSGEEVNPDEPAVDEALIQKVIGRTAMASMADDAEELNPAVNRADMMKEIVNLLGIPYHYGGTDATRGLDCSAFTGMIYSRAFGVRLPRSSNEQFGSGIKVKRNSLRIGDLVFFKTRHKRAPVSHVGIYVGENLFAHASTRHGVIISTLEEGYYNKKFVGARRVLAADLTAANHPRNTKTN